MTLPLAFSCRAREDMEEIWAYIAQGKGWSVVLDPDNRMPEIFEGNNRIPLP